MTASNRAALKALFETGDTLLQTSFSDLIDSFVDLVDPAAQTIVSDVTFMGDVIVSGALQLTSVTSYGIRGNLGFSGNLLGSVVNVAATGTTGASAAPATGFINFITSVSADSNSGIILTAQKGGVLQMLINNVSATAIIYPPSIFTVTGDGAHIDGVSSVKLMPNQRMVIMGQRADACYTLVGGKAGV